MVREASLEINREMSNMEIRNWILERKPDANTTSINCAIASCTVNSPSRIHYQENKKPRISNGSHDFLFSVSRGKVIRYDPALHGIWEIRESPEGQFSVRLKDDENINEEYVECSPDSDSSLFALESHLRDYLAKNLRTTIINNGPLSLYNEENRDGVEYQTDVGPIDILATDQNENFVVLELKLGRGADAALGQILRYMGWVEKHLANGKAVRGIIIASEIPKKLKYAITQTKNVSVMEYELKFSLKGISL
jgi:RecB family endonuclease NucS